jgi:hypothetical protein
MDSLDIDPSKIFEPPAGEEKLNCYPDPGFDFYRDLEWQGYVMVEAGGCSYETKARNIQNIGA